MVGGSHDESLVVCVTSPAEGGRANRAVVDALATALAVPRRTIEIASGTASRRKMVVVELQRDDDVMPLLVLIARRKAGA